MFRFWCFSLVLDTATELIKPAVSIFVLSHVLGVTLARIRPSSRCRHPCDAKPLGPVVLYGKNREGFIHNGNLASGCNGLPNLITVGPDFFTSYGGNQAIKEEPKGFKVFLCIAFTHILENIWWSIDPRKFFTEGWWRVQGKRVRGPVQALPLPPPSHYLPANSFFRSCDVLFRRLLRASRTAWA